MKKNEMKNRFKFRVWDKNEQKMIYPKQLTLCENGSIDIDDEHWIEKGYYELMQCSGLKDKNGELIYEGDIVEYCGELEREDGGEEYRHEIKWDYNRFKGSPSERDICKIIGNIYENPELLGEKNE